VIVTARGESAGLREGVEEALSLEAADRDIGPKSVHAYVTGLLAQRYGLKIFAAAEGGGVRLTINIPSSLLSTSMG
jgi:hypothetical protein